MSENETRTFDLLRTINKDLTIVKTKLTYTNWKIAKAVTDIEELNKESNWLKNKFYAAVGFLWALSLFADQFKEVLFK